MDRKRSRKSTGLRINPNNWDTKKQRAKINAETPHQNINSFLSQVQRDCLVIQSDYLNNGQKLTPMRLFEELWQQGTDDLDLISFANDMIAKKQGVTESTKAYYKDALRSIELYCQTKGATTDFQMINDHWYENYNAHLKNRGNKPATRKQYRQFFRTLFNDARKQGFHKNELSIRIKDPVPTNFKIALTDQEISALFHLQINSSRLSRIRDLFVLACRTGLRFSDWGSIKKPSHGNFLTVTTKKTKKVTRIPIHPEALMIMEKYPERLPTENYLTELKRLEALMSFAKDHIPSLSMEVDVPVGDGIESKPRYKLIKI